MAKQTVITSTGVTEESLDMSPAAVIERFKADQKAGGKLATLLNRWRETRDPELLAKLKADIDAYQTLHVKG